MKKYTVLIFNTLLSFCLAQNNWIYYNKISNESESLYSIWRIDENGENDIQIYENGYLLDISEEGNYMLFSNYSYVVMYNLSSETIDPLPMQAWIANFTSDGSKIIYASQTELFIYDIISQESVLISDIISYESNFYYSPTNQSVVFYEQDNIALYNIENNEKIILSNNALSSIGDGFSHLSWSPSNYVYYECIGTIDGYGEFPQICRVSSDGNSTSEQITNVFKYLLAPISNSSSHENVAISEIDEDNYSSVLHIFDSESGELNNLSTLEGTFIKTKIWSKDNNSLYISSYSDDFDFDSYKIWRYNFLNGSLINIANGTNPVFVQNEELFTEKNYVANEFNISNYPNPFNPATKLQYDLPKDEFVIITIYDMLGNVINNLLNDNQNSGYKSVQWDATNNQGQQVSAGVYLYSIEAGDFRQTKKMILLK